MYFCIITKWKRDFCFVSTDSVWLWLRRPRPHFIHITGVNNFYWPCYCLMMYIDYVLSLFAFRRKPGYKRPYSTHPQQYYKPTTNHKSHYLLKSKHPVFSYIDGFPGKASASTYIPNSNKYQPSHSYNQKKFSNYIPSPPRWENSQKKSSSIVDKTFNIDRATILSCLPTEVTNPLKMSNTSH